MAIIGVFTVEQVKLYARQHQEMWWIALVIMIVSLISLACCPGVRRKTPHNFVFLGLFTVAEGFLLGAVTSTYDANEVLMAVGVCAAITLALTVFAFQTKVDFTAMGGKWLNFHLTIYISYSGVLIAVLMVFFLFGLIAIFLPQSRTLRLVYASIGAIIFSLYIIYDTQLMVGGSHKVSFVCMSKQTLISWTSSINFISLKSKLFGQLSNLKRKNLSFNFSCLFLIQIHLFW